MQRNAQSLRVTLQAVSDHYTGSSFRYINVVLYKRNMKRFSVFYKVLGNS